MAKSTIYKKVCNPPKNIDDLSMKYFMAFSRQDDKSEN